MTAPLPHAEPIAIHAVPAELSERGFRLLALREFLAEDAPPAFALIEQHLLRAPQRLNRHGVSFALTFRPEIIAALSQAIGRPSQRDEEGRAIRNAHWPQFGWSPRPTLWPDGTRTRDWWAEISFPLPATWAVFQSRWAERLAGRIEAPP